MAKAEAKAEGPFEVLKLQNPKNKKKTFPYRKSELKLKLEPEETYPILHEEVKDFMDNFIQKMRTVEIYKQVYAQIKTWKDLVQRLVSKRPFMFMGEEDQYLNRSGEGGTGIQNLSPVADYITYDEIALGGDDLHVQLHSLHQQWRSFQ